MTRLIQPHVAMLARLHAARYVITVPTLSAPDSEEPSMQSFPINFLALVAATVAKGVLGWLWYSPPLFLKPWMRLTGVTDAQMKAGMGKALAVEVAGNFVMAFVLVHAVHYAGAR